MLLVILIISVLSAVAYKLLLPIPEFFRRFQAKQEMASESRACLDTIIQALRRGDPSSIRISTSLSANAPPNSQIDFTLTSALPSGTSAYSFYWDNNQAHYTEYRPAGASDHLLAHNVTGLMFTGDPRDPTVIGITLRIDAPYAVTAGSTYTFFVPKQIVRMGGTS